MDPPCGEGSPWTDPSLEAVVPGEDPPCDADWCSGWELPRERLPREEGSPDFSPDLPRGGLPGEEDSTELARAGPPGEEVACVDGRSGARTLVSSGAAGEREGSTARPRL